MSYLVLHIDMEFIVGTVCTDNGYSYLINNGADNFLWLYFFNNPHQNRISFGKYNKEHYNNKEINYYGNFFNLIENEYDTFEIRGIQKKTIELLNYSGLIKILKEKYESVTHDSSNQIPTLVTFSLSIKEFAKQRTVEYLKSQGFRIDSYTIPLSELTCYYPFSKQEFIPANGNAVLLLAATNTSLFLMKLVFLDNYFMIDGEVKIYKGKGIDPRKRALVKFVVNEVNNSVGALSTQDEIEDECARKEQKAEDWLKRIDAQIPNGQLLIIESLSIMPNAKRQIFVRKDNIESDTGHYIQELIDIYEAYKSDNVKGDVAAIFLLGDCFQNTLVRDRFESIIRSEKLFFYANKDIQQILSCYPSIDYSRYIDKEARSKALAQAEGQKQAEQRALEDKQRKEAEIEAKKEAEAKKIEQCRKEAEILFNRAVELEKEGRLDDARVNAENAMMLDIKNLIYKQFVFNLIEKIEQLNAKNELYKSYLKKADKHLEKNELGQALDEYEAAQSVFDNAEISRKIIEVKRLIKYIEKNKAIIDQLLTETRLLKKQGDYALALEKVNEVLSIDKEHSVAKDLFSRIKQLFQQQIEKQHEEEKKIKCEKILDEADAFFESEKWTEAQWKYEIALGMSPQKKNIIDKIKQCVDKINEKEEAFKDYVSDATILETKGRLTDALNCLEKALLLQPDANLLLRIKKIKNKIKFDFGDDAKNNASRKDNKSPEKDYFLESNVKSENKKSQNAEDDFLGNSKIDKTGSEQYNDFLGIPKPIKNKKQNDNNDFNNW